MLLCDHAQVAGKLFVSGASIDSFAFQPGDPGPYAISFAIAGVVHVPYTETNVEHSLRFSVVDADGKTPDLGGGAQAGPEGIGGEMRFNVGRPPTLPHGDEQLVPFAFQILGLPMAEPGRYTVRLLIDGAPVKSIPFRLARPQAAQSFGPAHPGPIGGGG